MFKSTPSDFHKLGQTANGSEPYLPQLTWALFSAYRITFIWAAFQAQILKIGVDARDFIRKDGVDQVLIKALPDHEAYIKEHKSLSHVHVVGVLRERILQQLRETLAGKVQDEEAVARASAIQKAVIILTEQIAEQQASAVVVPG